jgi:hypothetical protein
LRAGRFLSFRRPALFVIIATLAAPLTWAQFFGAGGSAATSATVATVANAGATGTLLNGLVKLTGAPSTAVRTATTDTGGAIGIVTAGAGTTGSATVQFIGWASCVFDGATTAGNYVQISSTVAGNCKDAGATYPTSGQVIGRVLSTNGAGGTYTIDLYSSEIEPSALSGSGTSNNYTKWTGTSSLGNGTFLTEDANFLKTSGPFDLTTKSIVIERPNDGVTGTTVNRLAKVDSAGNAVIVTTSAADQTAVIGCVIGGAGTTGNAQIAVAGQVSCLFDNTATTSGDYVVVSSATAATLNDAGSTYPASGMVLGRVLSTNASCGSPPCGPYAVLLMTPDVSAAGAGGGGKIANATAADIGVYSGTNKIAGNSVVNAPFLLKPATAVNSLGSPILKIDNPTAGNHTEIDFMSVNVRQAYIDASKSDQILYINADGSINEIRVGSNNSVNAAIRLGPTTNNVIVNNSGTFTIQNAVFKTDNTNELTYIGGNNGSPVSGHVLHVRTSQAASNVIVARATTNQTGNMFTCQDVTPSTTCAIGPLTKPANAGVATGTNEPTAFTITGAGGGDTTIVSTGTGGDAGGYTWGCGAGGVANSAATASTGGRGCAWTFTGSNGGAATAAGTTRTGGAAQNVTWTLGSGGNASGGTTNNGGAGAGAAWNLGSGGTGATANGADGTFTIKAGARANAAILAVQKNDGTNFFRVDQVGHLLMAGTIPTVGTCGTSPAVTTGSTDNAGMITTGSTATTSCVLTFANAWGAAPFCVANDDSAVAAVQLAATTTTLTFTYASATSINISYSCLGSS